MVNPTNNKKASILIIALWSLFLLTVFAVQLGFGVRQKLTLTKRLEERAQLYSIAEAGARKAIALMLKETEKKSHALKEPWSNNPDYFKMIKVGDGMGNICYNAGTQQQSVAEALRYGIVDEERKININKSDIRVLSRIFIAAGVLDEEHAQELAASIIDWRDADSALSLSMGSAEDAYYKNLKYPYDAKNADFEVLDELLLVKGMTQALFDRISPFLTVYGNGKININTASRESLLAIGFSEDMAEKILLLRNGKDGLEATEDDEVFASAADIVPMVSEAYNLGPAEVAYVSALVESSLQVQASNFKIRSVAVLRSGRNTAEVNCVISKKGKILYWRQVS
ncbi:MAG: hypothetical protein WDL87_00665 [Candidatus Omnitrophota bacterium]|jgi:general secretion pathway protein K